MPAIIGIPVLILTVVIQTTAFSRLHFLYGTADIVMLVILAWMLNDRVRHGWEWVIIAGFLVSTVSALPFLSYFWGYCIAAGLCYWLKRRIWQTPVLAMLVSAVFGTLVVQGISMVVLQITGSDISIMEGLRLVVLPSILWNLILAIPAYTLVGEMVDLIYPQEVEV